MKIEEFRQFLSKEIKKGKKGIIEPLTLNAVNARISRAGRLEKELKINLEDMVKDINTLKSLKLQIKQSYPTRIASTLYNTATRYYKFLHGIDPEKKYKDFLRV